MQTSPAHAQSADEARLDALIGATESDAGALAAARQQVAAGDLTGAATTLERSLLLRSGASSDPVRLYYGTVLCRLGDYRRGAYQLANVRSSAVEGWTEARDACAAAPPATAMPRGNTLTGILTLGVGYESDALGSLTNQFDFPGFPAPEEEGVAIIGTAALDARFASRLSGHGYAGGALQTQTEVSGPDTDYTSISGRLGYAWRLRGQDRLWSAGAVARHSILFGDGLVTDYGVESEFSDGAGATGRWAVRAEVTRQDFLNDGFGVTRDGTHFDLGYNYRSIRGLNRAWTLGAALEVKDAEQDGFGYVGGRVFGAMQMPISDDGRYFSLSGVGRHLEYDDGPFGGVQNETRSYVRAGVGIPLNRSGLFAEAAVSHSGRWYDDASFLHDYNSFGAEVRLVYRFGVSRSPE